MSLLRKAGNALAHLRQRGYWQTARYARERVAESYHEWRLGIQTLGNFRPEELGIDNPFAIDYYPTDYGTIYKSLRMLPIRPGIDGFLDFGCGMGRIAAVARTFPFRTVVGVELSPTLADAARQNLARARRQYRSGEARIVNADAQTFPVPSDINYVFFYNPFHGPILRGALENIRLSLSQAPRPLTVIFKNTTHFEPIMSEYPWLIKQREFAACDADHQVVMLEARA